MSVGSPFNTLGYEEEERDKGVTSYRTRDYGKGNNHSSREQNLRSTKTLNN